MIHYERILDIDATPDALWAVIGRFMHIDEFAPLVKSVDALTDGEDGIGSKRRCNFDDGTSVVEEVTQWEANRRYRVRLSEMTAMPLNEAHAELSVEPLDSGRANSSMCMKRPITAHRAFEAGALPSGVYFYRLEAGAFQTVRQMLLLR